MAEKLDCGLIAKKPMLCWKLAFFVLAILLRAGWAYPFIGSLPLLGNSLFMWGGLFVVLPLGGGIQAPSCMEQG